MNKYTITGNLGSIVLLHTWLSDDVPVLVSSSSLGQAVAWMLRNWGILPGGGFIVPLRSLPILRLKHTYFCHLKEELLKHQNRPSGKRSVNFFLLQESKFQGRLVLRGYFHECPKRKCGFLPSWIHVHWHNACIIYKLPFNKIVRMSQLLSKLKQNTCSHFPGDTWKLSKVLCGMVSSNCCMVSQGPSPTPTNTIDNG